MKILSLNEYKNQQDCGCMSEGFKLFNKNDIIENNPYRYGSTKFFDIINEAKKLWKENKYIPNEIDKEILSTDIGEKGIYEGKEVYLDFPYINEEAEYKGKNVELNKPKRSSGPKKYYVYVKNPKTGKIIKVNFGDAKGGLTSKIHNPEARKAFAARHDCKNKRDKTTSGYWACNLPRYGLVGKKMNTYW